MGLSKDGITMRCTVFGGLDAIELWSRLWMEEKNGSLESVNGIKVMLLMDGWVRRFVRSNEWQNAGCLV